MLSFSDPHLRRQILRALRVRNEKFRHISFRLSSPCPGRRCLIHSHFLRLPPSRIYNPGIDFD
jgi:hypothetical protein